MASQGVVTYMSCVEAFATRIKIESSDQSLFWGADQGIKVTSKLRSKNLPAVASTSTDDIARSDYPLASET